MRSPDRTTMPRYLIERTFAARDRWADGDDARCLRARMAGDSGHGVTWLHSYVTPDRRRSFCIVDSPSPEAIRAAADARELPVDRITEVRVLDPYSLG